LLLGCGSTTPTPSTPEATSEEDDPIAERQLPELRRLGDVLPGDYLFAGPPLDASDALIRARLVTVGPDAFTVSVEGGPHREVERRRAWPMACLRRAVQHQEGALSMRMQAGAPVFVLASSQEAARVSLGLATEHSRVVPRDAISLEGCGLDVPSQGARRIASTARGDVACLFADQETLDVSAGLPLPAGAPVRVLEEDGEWARVEIAARGGTLRGWMGADLVADGEGSPDWDAVALTSGHCVFPGRADPRQSTLDGSEAPPELPSIPAAEIERVLRNGAPEIQTCFEARRNERPDLRVVLDVVILVDASGRVSSARVTRGGDVDPPLTSCVTERVRRWRFPAPRFGSVELRRTFDLR
jgi:hypothetical protein